MDLDNNALAAFARGQFKGICSNQSCGLYGHKGVKCNTHPNNRNKIVEAEKKPKFTGEC